MPLLEPTTLKMLFNGDPKIKRAMGVLKDRWQDIDDDNPFMPNQITPELIGIAKQLLATGMVKARVDFNDYQSVQAFILHNNSYVTAESKQLLLSPFE
ncbi:hypothetical protein MOO44_06990 [Nicoliella spurrieriana]|uniref:Uncharacterized protein n=1 Tax=Nicoliella spurrieriana TaxID=2925830 RepID=A0A976X5I7_9LACO|nr:hypothetical protein [Nicoliella spurrieriana]UQS86627.1 hypothetical protein MOO44_06990 [Nicoliella spurrieriana]